MTASHKKLSPAILPTLLAATFMGIIDTSIVNVASPSIQKELPATFDQIQLIIAGYIIAYGVALIIGGRLGDTYGRKKIFQLGLLLFTLSSLACAISANATILIIARILQGFSGAIMLPQVLSIIRALLEGPARARSLGIYGATIGIASIAGQLVGGVLISLNLHSLGWRSVFLVNVPIGILALILSFFTVPESKADQQKKIDIVGAGLLGITIAALLYPLVEAPYVGWRPLFSLFILIAALTGYLFITWEHSLENHSREPLMQLGLFREPRYRTGMLLVLTFYGANAGFYLTLAYFFQSGLHVSPLISGLGYAPLGLGFMLGSILAKNLVEKFGTYFLVSGALLKIIALSILLLQLVSSPSVCSMAPTLFIDGIGEGLIAVTLIGKILAGVSANIAGMASGALLTMTQIANVLSVVLAGTLFSIVLAIPHYGTYEAAFSSCLLWLIFLTMLTAGLLKHLNTIEKKEIVAIN